MLELQRQIADFSSTLDELQELKSCLDNSSEDLFEVESQLARAIADAEYAENNIFEAETALSDKRNLFLENMIEERYEL